MFGPFGNLELLLLIGGSVALLWLFLFVAAPAFIYFTQKQAAHPELVPFFPGHLRLPAAVDKYFSDACWALDAEGFRIVTGILLPKQTKYVTMAFILVVNRDERTSAFVVAIHTDAPRVTPTTRMHVEFVTRFRDGRVVQTNNAATLSAFPTPEHYTNTLLPSITDPRQLYRLHCAQLVGRGGGAKVLLLDDTFAGDAVAYVRFAMIEELEHACRTGYMRLDASAGVYRPTIKGACLMTWRELWPIKAVRLAKRLRREKRLLEELAHHVPVFDGTAH